ncbi:Glycosyl transferase family 2 [Paenibacillus sp. UNCCL117]|uniref:glycosyltransferase n=1 Tax=unclassified Paenibacillus TaxID=185978 RepID=UPI00089033BF|nr:MULTISPECIES: glycosyltransferase [unclassified Paenibacillus]SDD30107.1 Glycosyl transferase family 2 [Paenibacillus sp. cl123]SFW40408.1 Glycosyl transferase family 2 [Paenibacillus sp. UNCCL117]
MYPKVSIVIPFYNDPYIGQAVSSAVAQTYPNVEIIVVDDGSTRHANILAPFMDRICYLGKANGGTASALNHGIRMASGEYIAWLSSDDMFYPHKLMAQLPFMLERGGAVSFSSFDLIDAYNRITQQHVVPTFPNYGALVRSMIDANPINGCTVIARKDVLVGFGLFDEQLPYTQDYDMWIRLMLNGIHFHFYPGPLIQYRWHPAMGTERHRPVIEQEIAMVRGRYRHLLDDFARRHGG